VQEVSVSLADGRTLTKAAEFPRDRPAYGDKEIEKKFHELAGDVLTRERRDAVIEAVHELPSLADVSKLTSLLSP